MYNFCQQINISRIWTDLNELSEKTEAVTILFFANINNKKKQRRPQSRYVLKVTCILSQLNHIAVSSSAKRQV